MPELLLADQVLKGAAPRPFLDEEREPRLLVSGEGLAEPAEQAGAIPTEDVAKEKLGIGFGTFDSGTGESFRRPTQRGGDGQAGSGTLSFSAW